MNEIEVVLLLLVIVAALTPLARKLRVPYPILLVLGGLILALLPILPTIPLEPELVFLLFLPPLIYSAAITTPLRDLKVLGQHILSLAVGLVLATTLVVALLMHWLLPELGWPVAFAFGAIVSPPDAVAAAAVFRGLGVPRKVVVLLEGESLVNDATALVAYRAALGATAVAVTVSDVGGGFAVVAAGGTLVGLAVAWLIAQLHRRISDPSVEITLSLLTPFAAYLPAEALGVSGVLAAVAAGLYLGWRAPYIWRSEARLRNQVVWEMVDFVLNGLVFILIGLQLSIILRTMAGRSLLELFGLGLAVSITLVVVRLVWLYLNTYMRVWTASIGHRLFGRPAPTPLPPTKRREIFIVGWAGMRGVVSLAAVLALPQETPDRNVLIFLTFFVILATLVGQGLTLPLIIRALGVGVDPSIRAHRELHARQAATEAALARIEQLRGEWPTHQPLIDTLYAQYSHRASHYVHEDGVENGAVPDVHPNGAEPVDAELLEHHVIRRAVLGAERTALLDLRERGEIEDEIWRDIEHDLDLEELRMDA
jgi:CPA1 family monovalent cation:H+ antiporter